MEKYDEHEQGVEQQRAPRSLLTPQQAMLAGGTLATTWAADLLMHGGPTGFFLGALATFIVARHSGDILETVRPGKYGDQVVEATARILHAEKQAQPEDQDDQSVGAKLQRLFRLSSSSGYRPAAPANVPTARQPKKGHLALSGDYQPHVDDVLGHCILCVGQRGTGKSNVAARLVEQLGRYPIPMLIIDYKQDYITLPSKLQRSVIAGAPDWEEKRHHEDAGYWELDTSNAFDAGYSILENGVQVIFQVISYEHIDAAAEVLLGIVQGMFKWAQKQPAGKRIPALVLLDEAQQFLPQQSGISQINPDLSKKLLSIFERLNSIGRSLGLTPAFFTQRVAQIKKEVIGGSEIFWLLKQSIDQDLSVYEALLGKENINRKEIQSFQSGQALVFSYGDVLITRFYERESEHLSVTPGLNDALSFYGRKSFSTSLVSQETRQVERSLLDEWEELTQQENASQSPLGLNRMHVLSLRDSESPVPWDPTEMALNEPEKTVPDVYGVVPMLGPNDKQFTPDQTREFLQRYRRNPAPIKDILRQMNEGEGLGNRYFKYASWLLKVTGEVK